MPLSEKGSTWPVRKMLTFGFGIATFMTVLIAVVGYFALHSGEKMVEEMIVTEVEFLIDLERASNTMLLLRRYEKDFLLNINAPDKQQGYLKKHRDILERGFALSDEIAEDARGVHGIDSKGLELAKGLRIRLQKYEMVFKEVVATLQSDASLVPQDGNKLMGEAKESIHEYEHALGALNQVIVEEVAKGEEEFGSGAQFVSWLQSILGGTAFLLAAALAFTITGRISAQLGAATKQLWASSGYLQGAAGEIRASSQALASGASEQAASVEEISASLTEIASQISSNAENSSEANTIMTATSAQIDNAAKSMEAISLAMDEINEASQQISKIIQTIDAIAFQTNLLALNAAVEAARAGEAGAGFAVVAEEVRNLAVRSAEAARNTSILIGETVEKIEEGGKVVVAANTSFNQVVEGSGKVGALISEISAASREQSDGLAQISQAVNEVDRVVQQVVVNAEEAANASEAMNSQVQTLGDVTANLSALAGIKAAATGALAAVPFRNSSDEEGLLLGNSDPAISF